MTFREQRHPHQTATKTSTSILIPSPSPFHCSSWHTSLVFGAWSPFGKGGRRGIGQTEESPLTPLFQRGGPLLKKMRLFFRPSHPTCVSWWVSKEKGERQKIGCAVISIFSMTLFHHERKIATPVEITCTKTNWKNANIQSWITPLPQDGTDFF